MAGPDLVLLHAFPLSSAMWRAQRAMAGRPDSLARPTRGT
jgi:pimeloyl-ACP methyl ester carboxylesterase